MTLSDLEWLSKIFNDTKRLAVSLRQLSFLLSVDGYVEENRTEFDLIVHIVKSEAEVTNNKKTALEVLYCWS